jgi:hypothetical protein
MSERMTARTRANIEIIVLGFLVGLALKAGLDAAY